MTDLSQAGQFAWTMTWLREARRIRAAALIAVMGTPLGRDGCTTWRRRLTAQQLFLPADKRVLEASVEMAGRLTPGPQSGCRINACASRSAVSLGCQAGRGAIAVDAG
jgi:hypothetical protein